MIGIVTGVMSRSPRNKGGATDTVFQEQWFLWQGGASVGTVKIFHMHKNLYNTLKEWKKNDSVIALLSFLANTLLQMMEYKQK